MKRERVLVVVFIVTAVLTLLFTSLVTADSHSTGNPPVKEEAPKAALGGGEAIIITKTVGVDPANCANTQTVVVAPGTNVIYCYQIKNTGNINLTVHDLEDSQLGTILNEVSFVLAPGSVALLTQTAVITTATVNTATWTAANPGPTNTISYSDGATVIANPANTCRFPALSIPDDFITGTTTTMNLNGIGTLADLDIYLELNHTWVGDLQFTLQHLPTKTTVELINRPGNPTATFGCQSDDIRAIIDDEALADVETSCGPPNLALAGRFIGGDPANSSLLTAFDGQDLSGEWQLHITDHANGDTGTLDAWCLLPTFVAPNITVTPSVLTSTQPAKTQTTQMLRFRNSGNAPLEWTIHESYDAPTAQPDILPLSIPPMSFAKQTSAATDTADDNRLLRGQSAAQSLSQEPVAAPPMAVLHDNGPLVNRPGAGANGADASVVQTLLGLSSFGYDHQVEEGNTVADDFTITDPTGWYVDSIDFFAYQSDSSLLSTITAVNYRIWDGSPDDPGSNIVINPALQNQLLATAWSGIYRVSDTTITATNRPIMQNITSGGFVLPPGTYWLEWQTDGSPSLSGPWVPAITISGVVTTGNALQFINGTWQPLVDTQSNASQGLPFVISGHTLEGIPWATVDLVSGTLSSGTTDVMVTFDSTGLEPGVYTSTLLIASNDPDAPLVPIPLTLTVELNIIIYLPFITKP